MNFLLIVATLLALGAVLAEGTAEVGDDLQKRQGNSDTCGSTQVDSCQQALNSKDNDKFCDQDCLDVLTDYYQCQGFDEVQIPGVWSYGLCCWTSVPHVSSPDCLGCHPRLNWHIRTL